MKIELIATGYGAGTLDTETLRFEPSEARAAVTVPVYLHIAEAGLTDAEREWIDNYVIETHVNNAARDNTWAMGATLKTSAQLAEIERRTGKKMILNQ